MVFVMMKVDIKNTYCVSKMIVITYARILTKQREISREVISVYSCYTWMVKK